MFWKSRKTRTYDVDALLPFLPVFESQDFRLAEWQAIKVEFPCRRPSADVVAFLRTLEEYRWIDAFDWMACRETVQRYTRDPALLVNAVEATISKWLTTWVNQVSVGNAG